MRHRKLAVAMMVVAAGCTTATGETTTTAGVETSTTAPATTSAPSQTSTTTAASTLSAPVRAQLSWFLSLLNGAGLDAETYETRFAQAFRDQVPLEQMRQIVEGVAAEGSAWGEVGIDESTDRAARVRVAPAGGEPTLVVSIAVDADDRIEGLFLEPAEPPTLDDPPETRGEAADRLAGLGELGYLVADVTDGRCEASLGTAPDQPMPLGSMFKLYVLGAVVDAVEAGDVSWDEEVEIVDRLRSLPSGIVQEDPPGSTRTVRELAELMISISDNTATDHLIDLVGREAVEAAQADWGHADPDLNRPFLTTRELFVLKLADRPTSPGAPGALGEAYLAADEAEQRRILAEDVPAVSLEDLDVASWSEPIAVEDLEWFASPADLCRVMAGLAADPEAAAILSQNPGIPDQDGRWEEIAFKGGSEPGVLGMAWHVVDADGNASVVAGTVWNPEETFDPTEAALLFGALRDLD